MFELLIATVVLAFIFDFINGFHDSANSIATIVSTRVLTPFQAVVWAAFFNFVAYWISEFKVADTIAKTVHPDSITLTVIFSGLVAAIIWNLATWYLGIPSSSSHTLIGGFAGAAIAHGGFGVVNMEKISTTIAFIVVAPFMGMFLSYIITVLALWFFKGSSYKSGSWFKRLQLISSAALSITHGGNDAQKVMGIIAAALIIYAKSHNLTAADMPDWMNVVQSHGKITGIPPWVALGCYTAIGLGTLMGGWRIIKTMGSRITKIAPFEGFTSSAAGAATLFFTENLGIPVSTTHVITGTIIGVGLTRRISAVRWGLTINILWAWILTIPVSGVVGGLIYTIIKHFLGE